MLLFIRLTYVDRAPTTTAPVGGGGGAPGVRSYIHQIIRPKCVCVCVCVALTAERAGPAPRAHVPRRLERCGVRLNDTQKFGARLHHSEIGDTNNLLAELTLVLHKIDRKLPLCQSLPRSSVTVSRRRVMPVTLKINRLSSAQNG